MGQSVSRKNASKPSTESGLILYYHPLSYYSQKVSNIKKYKPKSLTFIKIDFQLVLKDAKTIFDHVIL